MRIFRPDAMIRAEPPTATLMCHKKKALAAIQSPAPIGPHTKSHSKPAAAATTAGTKKMKVAPECRPLARR